MWARVRPAIFWSYHRGSWQYDVIVALILAFIFLVPKSLFNDRPSEAVVREIDDLSDATRVFWIDPGALDRAYPEEAASRLQDLLLSEGGETLRIVRTEPARDAAGNVRAYIVYAKP
jgi:hypothetical protein